MHFAGAGGQHSSALVTIQFALSQTWFSLRNFDAEFGAAQRHFDDLSRR